MTNMNDRLQKLLASDKTIIMGILNVTPDSFSDGGTHDDIERAIEHAKKMLSEGADIIDIGGESTRPGFTPVSSDDECARVIPVIKAIREFSDVTISVDTTKLEVARESLAVGADIINDISCLKDKNMAKLVADAGCYYILMHNRDEAIYKDFMAEYYQDLQQAFDELVSAGISKEKIILDPGVGFAKDYQQNLMVIKDLDGLKRFGCEILLGVSRKSVVGNCLGLPVNERLEGTMGIDAYGIMHGAKILRVHDVKEHVRMARMIEAIKAV